LKVGDDWLVLSQGRDMAFGDVFRFAEDGSYRTRFNLPAEVDPLAIARLGTDVIVADYAGLRLLRYGDQGQARGELAVPEISRYAVEVRAARDRFALYQSALWILFVVALAAGFAIAIAGELKHRRDQKSAELQARSQVRLRPVKDTPRPSANDPDIHWIGAAESMQRRLLFVCLLIGAGGPLAYMAVMHLIFGDARGGLSFIVFAPVFILVIASTLAFAIGRKMLANLRIGALHEWLLVRNWRNRIAIGRGDEIVLAPGAIAIEGVAVPLGRGKNMMMFDPEEWNQWIEPRLSVARKLTGIEILQWNWKYQRIHIVTGLAAVLILLAWELTRWINRG
jgi:hypothetical protein